MEELRKTLEKYAADACVEMISCNQEGICLAITIPSRGNEKWYLLSSFVIHVDMGTSFTLGSVENGNLELLSESYLAVRNFDFGGDKQKYRVIKFTDIDEKIHLLIVYGEERYETKAIR